MKSLIQSKHFDSGEQNINVSLLLMSEHNTSVFTSFPFCQGNCQEPS